MTMPVFPYRVTELLHKSDRVSVYRAVHEPDRVPVILKVLDPRRCRPRDLAQLKNEYALGTSLHTEAVVTPLALEIDRETPTLVLADFGGEPLARQLGAPMALDRFLPLAVRIAEALAALHHQEIIHKDLKPQNILINPRTSEVKLADLGLASRLPREAQPPRAPELIEGSLPYLSPEQTGRMNRALDSRSDLYSLGVTLYELLTGRLPFDAKDALEWVHCHIARIPHPPSELIASVPPIVSAIVMKLLAKMPEERYQTAHGVAADFTRCFTQWHRRGTVDRFPLGERDISHRFQIPQKLYGRDYELAALLRAFERVVDSGAPELVMVSGYSGIGKSALVQELHKPIVRARGFFLSGKFDQYKRDIPYSTVVQAFQDLVLELLAASEDRLAIWRQRLLYALGVNAQLMIDVLPSLELVIGRQPAVPQLPPAEAQNRFRLVLQHFVSVFTQPDYPLALFLDDLQWADSASLGLLHDLVMPSAPRHLLVIGAYRDNEVSSSHPLMLALDEMYRAATRITHIVLGPLSPEHLASLLSDALHCRPDDAASLAALVHDKTAGNPFFAIQFLIALHDERLIQFDPQAEVFRWDVDRIRAKGFTDNVVALMVNKVVRLPAATQAAMTCLACLGHAATLETVVIAYGRAEDQTHADLWDAVRTGLVLRTDDGYRFLHDRVQEAAYSLIPEAERAAVHLQIGRTLRSHLSEAAIAERVFDLVSQLDRGAGLITDPAERSDLSRFNVLAGNKAKAAIAYASARGYFAQAAALLPDDPWTASYEPTFALYLELSECEYLIGSFQRADALFSQLLDRGRSDFDRAAVYRLRMRLYQVSGRYDAAVSAGFDALRMFGVTFPVADPDLQAATEAELGEVPHRLAGRRIADLVDAPQITDPDRRTVLGLITEVLAAVYIGRPQYFALLTTRAVNLSLQYGNTAESCEAYSAYAIILISRYGDTFMAYEFSEMSLRLNEKLDDRRLRGTLLHIHGNHVNFWRHHIATDFPFIEHGFRACLEVGDLVFAAFLAFQAVWQVIENGAPLGEALRFSHKYAAFTKDTHNETNYEVIRLEQQFIASLRGLTRHPTRFDDDKFDEVASLTAITRATYGSGIAFFHIMKLVAAVTFGLYDEALDAARRAQPVLGEVRAMPIEATYHFYYALALTSLDPQARTPEIRAILDDELLRLERWAQSCPANYQHRHALVSAELARIDGRDLEAARHYEQAIRSAQDNGFVQFEALANELAARLFQTHELDRLADGYLREARACYVRWECDGKVTQLDLRYPQLHRAPPPTPTATVAVRLEQLDLVSVVKASQTISGEIVLEELIRTLLQVVLEQGGAQRGYLLFAHDGEFALAAEATLERDRVVTRLLTALPVASASRLLPISIATYVARTKQRVLLDDAAAAPDRFAADPYIEQRRTRSVLCLPILRQAKVIGLLYLENGLVAGAFTSERLVALELLASQAAISVENALLLAKERAARASAEEAERRTAFLADAGVILGQSLAYEETLAQLGRLCVRSLAEWCVIDLVGKDGTLRRVASAHADPTKEPLLKELEDRYPPRRDSPHPAAQVLRSGEPLVLAELADDVLRRATHDEYHLHLVRALGSNSMMALPLAARGQPLGVLSLVTATPGRRYGPADLDLAIEVARRASTAIDKARLYREAQDAIRLRDEFLSIASHELRTPMTSLTLSLQTLLHAAPAGKTLDPKAISGMIRLAFHQTERLTQLIRDLLDVSRIETSQLRVTIAPVDLDAFVRDVVARFAPDLARARCEAVVSSERAARGLWDRSLLDQVVSNLLSNAIKFGAGKPIELRTGEHAGTAWLSVTDHGIGIDPESQSQVFDRFARAVSARHYGGLGLGLYISRKLVEAHHGTIRVESEPGRGSTFTVTLPCTPPGLESERAW
ncbi:MAG TPA: ATP-binding sensor histidine kinase [Kofleriaceae bacterium]|jgi:predicted ATPase/signal transduction histidine kinase|nr:ATP-binding sensor histidine kinase [Kofleriaceae bacterium]